MTKDSVKGQPKKGGNTGNGLDKNPQNIYKGGGTEADATYAYMIKEAGATQSKKDKTKTRKQVVIGKQWDNAEEGDLRSVVWLADREEGKAKTEGGELGSEDNPSHMTVTIKKL